MSSRPPTDPTLSYYDNNAKDYSDRTLNLDMEQLYAPFLSRLPARGHILDVGCGPGRDAKAFKDRGFRVTAIDGSPVMCRVAGKHLGQAVHIMRFLDMEWDGEFDGAWACASLLHTRPRDLPEVLRLLSRALKSCGVLYASFKYGEGAEVREGRWFTDFTAVSLVELFRQVPQLVAPVVWVTADLRTERRDDHWLNVIATRC
jgi:SAM-dependent methyltransferase